MSLKIQCDFAIFFYGFSFIIRSYISRYGCNQVGSPTPRNPFASRGIFRAMMDTANAPLTGKALLQKVKELSDLTPREKARRCGYETVGKNEQSRVNLSAFYEALLAARGISLGKEGEKDGRGREPTYRVSVHKNGQIVIGSTYTEKMGLQPGDEFEIKLGYKHIHLIQIDRDRFDQSEENGDGSDDD